MDLAILGEPTLARKRELLGSEQHRIAGNLNLL
jgi:hypothetical protein